MCYIKLTCTVLCGVFLCVIYKLTQGFVWKFCIHYIYKLTCKVLCGSFLCPIYKLIRKVLCGICLSAIYKLTRKVLSGSFLCTIMTIYKFSFIHSCSQLLRAFSQLSQYETKYRSRLKARNLMYVKQILFVLSALLRCLGGQHLHVVMVFSSSGLCGGENP